MTYRVATAEILRPTRFVRYSHSVRKITSAPRSNRKPVVRCINFAGVRCRRTRQLCVALDADGRARSSAGALRLGSEEFESRLSVKIWSTCNYRAASRSYTVRRRAVSLQDPTPRMLFASRSHERLSRRRRDVRGNLEIAIPRGHRHSKQRPPPPPPPPPRRLTITKFQLAVRTACGVTAVRF